MWWRNRARSLLLLRPPLRPLAAPIRQVPLQTLTLTPSKWSPTNTSPFSSAATTPISASASTDTAPITADEIPSPPDLASDAPNPDLSTEADADADADAETLSSLWSETVDDATSIFPSEDPPTPLEPRVVDIEQVESVISLLQGTLQEPLDESLDKMDLSLSEEFVARIIQTETLPAENLVGFVKWALECNESAKTTSIVEMLVDSVGTSANLSKKEVYLVWDLLKVLGKEKGVLTTGILNKVISMFWKLGKANAGLEVFDKVREFGCVPDGDTYYLTIRALRTRFVFDRTWAVCGKMIQSGQFPDGEKTGEIVLFLCREDKHKEAHLVYSRAKAKGICVPKSCLDFLIDSLTRKGKAVKALKLLEDYSGETLKYANKSFSSVIRGLCMVKDVKGAKKLLLQMAELGPPPGSAAFNYVITALAKEGDAEDALALVKLMENRGLRPDVYTYTVIMSCYAKGGLMEEAHKVFREAKKKHPKLSPVSYHILTRGYCKLEEYGKALDCLQEMKEDGLQPNIDEYDKMIRCFCRKALDWRTAEKLIEEMKESGLKIKGTTRSLVAALKELSLAEEEVPAETIEPEAA